MKEPLPGIRKNMQSRLAVRKEIEKKLSQSRDNVQAIDVSIREKEQSRTNAEQDVEQSRSILEKLRLDSQEIKVRLQTVLEQLQTENNNPDQLLKNLQEGYK